MLAAGIEIRTAQADSKPLLGYCIDGIIMKDLVLDSFQDLLFGVPDFLETL